MNIMAKPLDDDFNYNVGTGITQGGISLVTPKQAKGGVFAPADISLIKEALANYAQGDIEDAKQRQVANLLHRLNSRM
jgi:hypothetical protein